MTPGERRLAQRLESKLEDDYLLWYDVPVGPQHLHPDFIILHPQRGIFVLEVKDWRLETLQSVTPDEFEIMTPAGAKHVKNPLWQARDYALAEVIDPHLVICRDEMTENYDPGYFQERLWAMSHYDFGNTLTSEQIDRVRWHLYPDLRISAKQLSFFDDEPAETLQTAIPKILKVMDLQQEQLARSLGEGHRVIHGVAGSGKTLILAYRCQHLAETMQSVLVLCFNVALASRLRSLMEEKGLDRIVTVRHFHGWCMDQLKQHRLPRPDGQKYRGSAFIEQLEKSVVAAVDVGQIPAGQYGAVMVDEGHDFEPEWLKLVAQMVNPSTDSLLVLYDDAQNLYGQRSNKQFSFKSVGIKAQGRTTILKLNYRNTAQVLMLAYEFAREVMEPLAVADEDMPPLIEPNSAGREGPVPELVKCSGFNDAKLAWPVIAMICRNGTPAVQCRLLSPLSYLSTAIAAPQSEASEPEHSPPPPSRQSPNQYQNRCEPAHSASQ